MSIDKVIIHGAEFTRVADRYLLQSEVEQVLAQARPTTAPHVERLTTLLEDIVNAADAVALEVVEAQAERASAQTGSLEPAAREVLREVREGLHSQIITIDTFMHRLEG